MENLGSYNRTITATADYNFDDRWGVMVIIPYIDRDHAHNIGPYSGATAADYESFHANAIGDVKAIGHYRWKLNQPHQSGLGVKFGLKLNTGKKDFTITQSGEMPSEATLQPGNGSTDMILGLFWHQAPPGNDWSWFAQGTLQNSVNAAANFRPGNQVNLDGGARYSINHNLSALLQLNAQWNDTDSGESAVLTESLEPGSGGHRLAITPGLNYAITHNTQLYGLVQLPLYQYVKGEQLTADLSISVGINRRF